MNNELIPGKDYVGLACGALIFNDRGEVFMALRSKNTRADHNMWGIPGGLVEFGETVEQAVRRECREECGIELGEIERLTYADHFLPNEGKHFVSQLFVVRTFSGTPTNAEPDKFDQIGWFALDQIPENTSAVAKTAFVFYKKRANS